MKKSARSMCLFLLALFCFLPAAGQRTLGQRPTPSGGVLIYEQAAYDVQSYDITASVYPETKSIESTTIITAKIISPVDWFVFDLDTPYEISSVTASFTGRDDTKLDFKRKDEKIWAKFPVMVQPGATVRVEVIYKGQPRVAPNPPWVGGFMWEKTPSGAHWIVNACQNDGGDCWFPIKDHPSDEPETVSLHITVPGDLYVASVGRLQTVTNREGGRKTYHWKMSNSINNYNVVLNIAPYKVITKRYKSIDGKTFPISFYALPESEEKARDIVDQTAKFLDFYEKYCGPYPYRDEKLGIAETPHLGMEHSTIIAYGNKFVNNAQGFDWLMLHELGHEWWGNMVTGSDWRDMWIHEGFQSFLDTLYLEEISGKDAYLASMRQRMRNTRNKQPVAPREPRISYQIYMAAPDYVNSDGDIYGKGAVVLHTLRYLIGDDAFFRSIRRMAYPTKAMESFTDGRQNRFVTTDDFKFIAETESGMDLDWFFDVYLRQPYLPKLVSERSGGTLSLRWETPDGLPFPMPVNVKAGDEIKRVDMSDGNGTVSVPAGQQAEVDPEGWIFRDELAQRGS